MFNYVEFVFIFFGNRDRLEYNDYHIFGIHLICFVITKLDYISAVPLGNLGMSETRAHEYV